MGALLWHLTELRVLLAEIDAAYEQLRVLQAEIDAAYEQLGLAQSRKEIEFRDAEKLPYLSAVIRESKRLYPPITYQLPRVPSAEVMQIGEYFVSSSANCGISPAVMKHDQGLFGNDASEWNPARWIARDDSEE